MGPRHVGPRGVRPLALVLAWAAAAIVGTRSARADDLPQRTTGVVEHQGRIRISVGLWDLFSAADHQRLRSGFVTRVLVRVWLHRQGQAEAIARTFQSGEIVYDLWDERFRVRISSPAGVAEYVERDADAAIRRATSLWQLPVVDAARLGPAFRYLLLVRADLNPVSEDVLADVRRWLLRPAAAERAGSSGGALFGSFASFFANPRVEESERQLRFASQSFSVGAKVESR